MNTLMVFFISKTNREKFSCLSSFSLKHFFHSGGIQLTVTGQYLNSVAFPFLEVSMVYYPNNGPVEIQLFDSVSVLFVSK